MKTGDRTTIEAFPNIAAVATNCRLRRESPFGGDIRITVTSIMSVNVRSPLAADSVAGMERPEDLGRRSTKPTVDDGLC